MKNAPHCGAFFIPEDAALNLQEKRVPNTRAIAITGALLQEDFSVADYVGADSVRDAH